MGMLQTTEMQELLSKRKKYIQVVVNKNKYEDIKKDLLELLKKHNLSSKLEITKDLIDFIICEDFLLQEFEKTQLRVKTNFLSSQYDALENGN